MSDVVEEFLSDPPRVNATTALLASGSAVLAGVMGLQKFAAVCGVLAFVAASLYLLGVRAGE